MSDAAEQANSFLCYKGQFHEAKTQWKTLPVANVMNVFCLNFWQLQFWKKYKKASKGQIVYLGCCFSLKMGIFQAKMTAKGQKLAHPKETWLW